MFNKATISLDTNINKCKHIRRICLTTCLRVVFAASMRLRDVPRPESLHVSHNKCSKNYIFVNVPNVLIDI